MTTASATPTAHSIFKAVIPAAGLGTRLRPLTRAFPKELLPVGREPVLSYITTELRAAGITNALFIISNSKPQIRAFFGDEYTGERPDLPPLHCEYATQTEQRGSGDALLYAQAWVGDSPFVVAFGDCIIEQKAEDGRRKTEDEAQSTILNPGVHRLAGRTQSPIAHRPSPIPLARLIATHIQHQAAATVLVEAVEWANVSRYGVVAPRQPQEGMSAAAFALSDIVEKPRVEDAPSNLVVAARWVLQPSLFPILRQTELDSRGERNITDAVRMLGQAGNPLWAVPLRPGEARRDIGNFESFFAQFVRAALRDPDFGATARRVAREELACEQAEEEHKKEQ